MQYNELTSSPFEGRLFMSVRLGSIADLRQYTQIGTLNVCFVPEGDSQIERNIII
jgi:hypothetical protein